MRRSIDFVVVFWGKKFRDQFLDYCLASLLAPNNLAAFSEPGLTLIDVRLIVCSTPEDFQAISHTALFRQLKTLARVEFIDMGLPERGGDLHNLQLHLSLGHKLALQKVAQAKSYGAFLAPDIVLADGSLRTLARHVRAGAHTVLAPALRFDFAAAVGQLDRAGVLKRDQPLTISPRALARIAVTSLHSELKRFEYDEDHFCDEPISTIFTLPGAGLLIHTSSWAIAAADFSGLPRINDSILDDNTLDAHFIHENLMASSEPMLLDDSDEYLMMPITTEEDFPLAHCLIPDPYLAGRPEELKDERKVTFIRTFLFSHHSDAFRRWASRRPVYIHYRDLPEGSNPVVTRSVALIERALATAPLGRPIYFFVAFRGEAARSAFTSNVLASLMAPNNAPALAGGEGDRLFIACSETDRAALIHAWLFRHMPSFLALEFIDVGEAGADDADQRLLDARRAVAARSIREDAYLSVLEPNLLLSDGAIARVIDLAKSGHEAALVQAFPVSAKLLEARLLASKVMFDSHECIGARPVQLSAQSLARHALASRYPSLRRPEWDSAREADRPFGAPDDFVVQAAEWVVLLIDLGAVAELRNGDVPDDFIERALAELRGRQRIHCVTDSDDIAVAKLLEPARPAGALRSLPKPLLIRGGRMWSAFARAIGRMRAKVVQ